MLFNSLEFLLFFVIVSAAYFLLPHRYRWILLLLSSCYFYMSFVPAYILILLFTIVTGYLAGIYMETRPHKKRAFFIAGLTANIGILAFFKYYNFLNENIGFLLGGFGLNNPVPYLNIILPIGLSFHTFQEMSYLIEVYRGKQKAERHFGIFSVYVMFYPQLVSGPIERPQNLLHQFYEKHRFNYEDLTEGLKLMLWGFFKKLVIADRLAIYVDAVYNNATHHNGITFLIATIFFSFQIYCDFSGYSDIAVGSARVMGFSLTNNFNLPYLSKSIAEFWSKWHISLSNWLRDYIYLPMVSTLSKKITKKKLLGIDRPLWLYSGATLVTFMVSGIWHGAAWTFVFLGLIHAFFLIFAIITKQFRLNLATKTGLTKVPVIYDFLQVVITFLLVTFAYIFFRANSFSDVGIILQSFGNLKGPVFYENYKDIAYPVFVILFLLLVELKQRYFNESLRILNSRKWYVQSMAYAALIIVILLVGVFDGSQFIYFQF